MQQKLTRGSAPGDFLYFNCWQLWPQKKNRQTLETSIYYALSCLSSTFCQLFLLATWTSVKLCTPEVANNRQAPARGTSANFFIMTLGCNYDFSTVQLLSCNWFFATPWTVAHQTSPSMEFSRQEYWSGFPCPSPGDLPDPRIKPGSHIAGSITFFMLLSCKPNMMPQVKKLLLIGLQSCYWRRNGNPFQYSFLENPIDRGVWWVMVHGATKSQT